MQAGAGGFANGVQVGNVGAPAQVGQHAAAGVVGSGDDGDGLLGDVDAQLGAPRQDVGKVLLQKLRALVRDVQVHAIEAVLFHLKVNGAGHDVARGQLFACVVLGHEARAVGQLELSALAPHGFAD